MPLRPLSSDAQRRPEDSRTSPSTEAATTRSAATAPGRDLQRQPFRTVLRDLDLTPNQVWGLSKTDKEWLAALDAALMATRRDDLEHGTNAAYVAGCVCSECRSHQRVRMAKQRN